MLTESDAEQVLQTFKLTSHDKVALPSSYKAIRARVTPALKNRFEKKLCVKSVVVSV